MIEHGPTPEPYRQPALEGLEDDRPTLEDIREQAARRIGEAALTRAIPDERNAGTARWLEEQGGGAPRDTLAEDPPRPNWHRRSDRRPVSKRKGMSAKEARQADRETYERRFGLSGRAELTAEEKAVQAARLAKLRDAQRKL